MYHINFDPWIYEVIRETDHMLRLGKEVPQTIKMLSLNKQTVMKNEKRAQNLLEDNNTLRRSIPMLFLNLLKPSLVKLEYAFQPCLSIISWTSLEIDKAFDTIAATITEVGSFVKEVTDMKEARMDEVFQVIEATPLLNLASEAQTPKQFSAHNLEFSHKISAELEIKSAAAEKAVIALINKFMDAITDPSVEESKYDWMDVNKVNKQYTTDANAQNKSTVELGKLV